MCERIISSESLREQSLIAADIAASNPIDLIDSGSTSPVVNTPDITTPTCLTSTVPTPVNYLKEYYSDPSHDLNPFSTSHGTSFIHDEKITTINKEIKKLTKKLDTLKDELNTTFAAKYSSSYTPITERVIIKYITRGYSKGDLYFELSTGLRVTKDSVNEDSLNPNDVVYTIHSKNEETLVLDGYAYEIASVIVKAYKITISSDNMRLTSKLLNEYSFSMLEEDSNANLYSMNSASKPWCIRPGTLLGDALSVNAETFINTLYGTSRTFKSTSLFTAYKEIRGNANFELIIKQAPDAVFEELLQDFTSVQKTLPELCNLDKETYREAVKRDMIKETRALSKVFDKRAELKKSPTEMFNLLDKFKTYEKDLDFYSIGYNVNWPIVSSIGPCQDAKLFGLLAGYYITYNCIKSHYSFGKYADYVIQESINQGYSSVNNFLSELKDYLEMCATNGVTPSLFSSYLKQTHDIAVRNSRILVSAEDEIKFKSRYDTFKPFKCTIKENPANSDSKSTEYHVIAPDNTLAVKDEGCQLNHCVMSYVKRIIDGECLIYFLRTDPKTSLITIEVKDNTIIQARGMHNRFPDEEEAAALKVFAEKRGLEIDY